ncbi:helix-turn-helix domain-containing protein [Kitasatospora sp. NPDC051170]|uniref:helix-turn-helix domain-containing protein n=1 Tax=Kitasatospora sp. NPDC051170 TaxID=3364056 RepID=UPI0037BD224C
MVGRPKEAVPEGAPAGELAEYLERLRARCKKTYARMAVEAGVSMATLSRATSGKRRPRLDVVQTFVRVCGGTPSELRKAERLWRRTPARASAKRGKPSAKWREPDALREPQHLRELMRAAWEASGSPSLREMEQRTEHLASHLSRSTLGQALRPGSAPTKRVFCRFMVMIAGFAGSPAARYEAETWDAVWARVHTASQGVQEPSRRRAAAKARANEAPLTRRRSRPAPSRPWTRPGPSRELADWLNTLFVRADMPSLVDIAEAVRLDDQLDSLPGKDLVRRLLRTSALGTQNDTVAVAVVLARMAGVDPGTAAGHTRELWVRAATQRPYGLAVSEATDPLALGVREAFPVPEAGEALPVLPPYVPREHDQALGQAVWRAVAGQSAMVVARGRRATGKTRSCVEALRAVPGSWRLWHPADPSNGEAVVEGLGQAGPSTVLWLDRIEQVLDPARCHLAGTVHAEIVDALHDPRRAPILVLGTVSSAAGLLTRSDGRAPAAKAAARALIEDSAVDVPDRFTEGELARLAELAGTDPRLALAHAKAPGSVARFLSADRSPDTLIEPQSFLTAVDQGDSTTLMMGGALLQESGRVEEAAIWYQRAAEAGDTQALEPAAVMLSESGTPYEAIRWLRMLAESGDAAAAVTAARRLLRDGRDDEAVEHYQRAAAIDGTSRTLRAAVSLMQRTGRAEEAVRWLQDLAAAGNPAALREAASLLWEAGDTDGALRFYREAGAAGDLEAWRDAAEHLQGLGRDEEALLIYREAVRAGDELSLLPLADLLATQGQQDEALEIYLEAVEKDPDHPDLAVIRRVAAVYRLKGCPQQALRWYRKATEHGDITAFLQIGLVLRGECDVSLKPPDLQLVEDAVAAFTKAAAAGERHAHREAAWLLWKYHGLDAAIAWLQDRLSTGDRRAEREMADLLREANRPDEALRWYSRAADRGSRYAAGHALRLRDHLSSGGGTPGSGEGLGD